MNVKTIVLWVLKLIPAGILTMTIVSFKLANGFAGHADSQALFAKMSEALGGVISGDLFRIGTAITEIIGVVLILVPKTAQKGALLIAGVMLGAIGSHLGPLGTDDPAFPLAIIVLAAAIAYLILSRKWRLN